MLVMNKSELYSSQLMKKDYILNFNFAKIGLFYFRLNFYYQPMKSLLTNQVHKNCHQNHYQKDITAQEYAHYLNKSVLKMKGNFANNPELTWLIVSIFIHIHLSFLNAWNNLQRFDKDIMLIN